MNAKNKPNEFADKLNETVNYKDGFDFDFEDDGHQINVRCSAKSGKEFIYVNGKLETEKRSFRRKSSHFFTLGKDHYEVEFHVVKMLTGETHCTLIKNDVHVKTLRKALLPQHQVLGKFLGVELPLSVYVLIGILFGYLIATYLLDFMGG
jgi:hypothetical protein